MPSTRRQQPPTAGGLLGTRSLAELNELGFDELGRVEIVTSIDVSSLGSSPYTDDEKEADDLCRKFYYDLVLQEMVEENPVLFNDRLYEQCSLQGLVDSDDSIRIANPGGPGTVSRHLVVSALRHSCFNTLETEYCRAVSFEYKQREGRRNLYEQGIRSRRSLVEGHNA